MSIQGFSKPASDLALWSADTQHQAHEVRAYLSSLGIWFIPCLGAYQGKQEMSYLTSADDFWRISGNLCLGQESVLILGGMDSRARRKATLRFLINGDASPACAELGRLYSIPAAEIAAHDAWTIPLQQPAGDLVAYVCGFPDIFGNIEAPDNASNLGRY